MDITPPRSRIADWRRLSVESLAVILSILLAFAIDAWWDGYKERRQERELLAGLLTDFESSRPALEGRLLLAERMAVGTGGLRSLLEEGPEGAWVTVPDSLVLASIGGPTYEPNTNTLDAAVASGEIELVTSEEIRAELATWRRTLADTSEDEVEVRRITNEQLVPELAGSVNVGIYFDNLIAWSGGDPYAAGRLLVMDRTPAGRMSQEGRGGNEMSGQVRVRAGSGLTGALALRKFYTDFSAADLAELLASLDRLVALISAELGLP